MPDVTIQPTNRMYFWTGIAVDPTLQDGDLCFWFTSIQPFTTFQDALYFDDLVPEVLTGEVTGDHIPPWTRKYPPPRENYFSSEELEGAAWDKESKHWYIVASTNTDPPGSPNSGGFYPTIRRLFRCGELFDDDLVELRAPIGNDSVSGQGLDNYRIREMIVVEVGDPSNVRKKVLVFHESPSTYNTPNDLPGVDPADFPPTYESRLFNTELDGSNEKTFDTLQWDKDISSFADSKRIYLLSLAPITFRFTTPSTQQPYGFYALVLEQIYQDNSLVSQQYKINFYRWISSANQFHFDSVFWTGPLEQAPFGLDRGSNRTALVLGRITWSEAFSSLFVPRQIFVSLASSDERTGYTRSAIDICTVQLTVQGKQLVPIIPLPNPHVEDDPGFGDPINVLPANRPVRAWEWIKDVPPQKTKRSVAKIFVAVDSAGNRIDFLQNDPTAGIFVYPPFGALTLEQANAMRQRVCEHPFREEGLPINTQPMQMVLGPGCY